MSVSVEKLPDEPIFIVTVDGFLNAEMVRELYQEIGVLTKDMEAPIYRITDVRKQQTTFMDMMGIIKEATKDMPGTTSDSRITNIFVGKEKFAKIARDVMQRINPDNHPMVDTIEEALTYIRWQLSLNDESSEQDANVI